ncbi:IBA57 homolog, iron-sulfur cluster assembly [Elysia marginata]|uniref:IBA57 homolog, iron-sulfur cluster assembly n=1 Tax=Elysia marginata TaxID=1093978 RepID=A0AAV4FU42_9GAST|nr:IBA57 homolog, iron-sulfur cluster assembly [Elysia marginata]
MGTFKAFESLRTLKRLIRIYSPEIYTSVSTKHSITHPQVIGVKHFHTSPYSSKAYTLSQLESRSVVQLSGNDTLSFLQGLVTNDVNLLSVKCPSTQYCMILNVQVDIADVSDRYKIWCQYNSSISTNSLHQPLTFHDPRVPLHGCRFILKENSKDLEDKGNVNVASEEEYTAWRYRLGLPEGVLDLPPGNCLPLESNLAFMNGVNFQKGCYVGQELTARTFHTGVIRKRIVPVQLEFPAEIDCEAKITTKEKGRNAGKFRNAVGIYGLSLLRLAHIKDDLVVTAKNGQTISLKPSIPDWWPQGVI